MNKARMTHTMPVKKILRRLMMLNDFEELACYRMLRYVSLVQFIFGGQTELYISLSCTSVNKFFKNVTETYVQFLAHLKKVLRGVGMLPFYYKNMKISAKG
jgi:hypothetical protein